MPSLPRFQRVKQIAIIVLAMLSLPVLAGLIGSGGSGSRVSSGTDQRSCETLRSERARLADLALACKTDEGCFHYPNPGSCVVLAKGAESTMLMSIDETLYRRCRERLDFLSESNCGGNRLVCVAMKCQTQRE